MPEGAVAVGHGLQRHGRHITLQRNRRLDDAVGALALAVVQRQQLLADVVARGDGAHITTRVGVDGTGALTGDQPDVVPVAGHLDVKPSNVIVEHDSGRVVLVDFGLAQDAISARPSDRVFGTLEYLAPEVLAGGRGGAPARSRATSNSRSSPTARLRNE